MGLSYAQEYVYTEHFSQRAQERFGIEAERLPKWINTQINSLVVYGDYEKQRPEERKYVSNSGVIFICNTVERKFVTCYAANDLLEKGTNTTIHDHNVELFMEEVEKLSRKYSLKDTKEMLLSIELHLKEFQEISNKLMTGRLVDKNYHLIGKLIDEFHVIRSAMRVIETKRQDFRRLK